MLKQGGASPRKGSIKKVFPGGNTGIGFHSFFDQIIREDANKIFVVKGGPGVGKSTFIRKIGEVLVEKGFDIEFHCCPSDNNSLDGVYIPALEIALIDGTAPHVVDPKNPGAVDEIIHLGDYWDETAVRANRTGILRSTREASRRFAGAFRYLSMARTIREHQKSLIRDSGALDIAGLNVVARELEREIFGGSTRNRAARGRHLFASGITPEGPLNYLETIVGHLPKRIILIGEPGTGKSTIAGKITAAAMAKGFDAEVYHCSLDPVKVDHVVIPELGTAVLNGSEPHRYEAKIGDQIINTAAYVRREALAPFIGEMSEAERLYAEVFGKGVEYVALAKKMHDEMETYYRPNMRFSEIDARRKKVLDGILELASGRDTKGIAVAGG